MSDDWIILSHGRWRAGCAPDLGGALAFLTRDGEAVLRPAPSRAALTADPRNAACFPCVPYFGRLAGIERDGAHHRLAPTLPADDPDTALHGEGWVSPWTVTARSASSLTMRHKHAPAPGRYPFAYAAEQTLALSDSGLAIGLSIENAGDAPMPAGLGLHPYFRRLPATALSFRASGRWTPPAGPLETPAGALASGAATPPPEAGDHTYAGFAGQMRIDGDRFPLRLTSDAPALHLYTPAGADFFCPEPVTHLPGAFADQATGLGAKSLLPRERLHLSLYISAG